MAEINAPATLVTPAGTISFNPTTPATDYYWLTDVQGLDGVALRAPIDNLPQADGGLVHDFLKEVRHVTIEGMVVFSNAATRNAMCDALVAALDALQAADGTFSWTPTGQSTKSLTVRCDQQITGFRGTGFAPKQFMFGLVAADPAIA